MTWLLLVLLFCMLGCSWRCIFIRRDAWPFSHYPMFSRPVQPETTCVYRVAVVASDGTRSWWRPHFYKSQQALSHDLTAILMRSRRHRRRALTRAVRLAARVVARDPATGPQVRDGSLSGLVIILRRCTRTPSGEWAITDHVVATAARNAVQAVP